MGMQGYCEDFAPSSVKLGVGVQFVYARFSLMQNVSMGFGNRREQ
jgi:hypothetical protein